MYDSSHVKLQDTITLDYILSRVSEYDIYAQYIGKFKVGGIYNSPFRKDSNPSFGVFLSRKTGKLLFKDHGSGECGDVIKFVQILKGIYNYNDILVQIVKDLKVTNNTVLKASTVPIHNETVIGIVRQPFTERDIEYWSKYGISVPTLEKFNVNSIQYYLCNGIVKGIYKDENPMYAYKVFDKFKIYRPYADKYAKWRNNLTEYDIQGYAQLPKKGDVLFITKSMKDVMCLYEMGIPAISPSSESTFIPNDILEDLKKRFKRIIILFDRDPAGVRYSRKISLKMGLEAMFVHKKYNAKDISDAIKTNSFEEIKEWLYGEIKKQNTKEEKELGESKECNS